MFINNKCKVKHKVFKSFIYLVLFVDLPRDVAKITKETRRM